MSNTASTPKSDRKAPYRPRRRRLRFSTCLHRRQATEIYRAAKYAATTQTPLNRFITIHLERGGVVDCHEKHIAHFLKQAGDWLRRQGHQLAYVWVREAGWGKGEHVHILMHIPPHLPRAFSGNQRAWLHNAGIEWRKKVINTKPIGRDYKHCVNQKSYGFDYSDELDHMIGYALKETEPHALKALGIMETASQSSLKGCRYGVAQALGPSARQRSGRLP